jgi:hypothetical protein
MITNFDIEEIASGLKLPIIGVFSKDKLPQRRAIGSYYVNMEDHDKGSGTHWVFMRIFSTGVAIYFDSFGISPPEPVRDFLKPFSPFAFSNRQIQDIKSENCGRFCILCDYFFTHQCRETKVSLTNPSFKLGGRRGTFPYNNDEVAECFDDFLNSWSINTETNDKILKERFNKLG